MERGLHASRLEMPVLIVHGIEHPIISTSAEHISVVVITLVQLVLLERKGVRLRLLGWVLPGAGAACAAMTVLAG